MSRRTELRQHCGKESDASCTDPSSRGENDSSSSSSPISNCAPSTPTTTTTADAPSEGPITEKTSITRHSSSWARDSAAAAAEQAAVGPLTVFVDRTYTLVDTGPDDVVSWSESGDSFIVKKIDAFEAMLPAFFNHRNFLSFVRQLNLYCFSKVKDKTTPKPTFQQGVAGKDVAEQGRQRQSADARWWVFKHPKFRRGCKELLSGVKRLQDRPRAKGRRRETADLPMDMLNDLRKEVEQVNSWLQVVDNKVDGIKSLLLNLHAQPAATAVGPRYPPAASGTSFGYGTSWSTPAPSAPSLRGWVQGHVGGGGSGGDDGSHGICVAPVALSYATHHPMNQERQALLQRQLQQQQQEQHRYQQQCQWYAQSQQIAGEPCFGPREPPKGWRTAHTPVSGLQQHEARDVDGHRGSSPTETPSRTCFTRPAPVPAAHGAAPCGSMPSPPPADAPAPRRAASTCEETKAQHRTGDTRIPMLEVLSRYSAQVLEAQTGSGMRSAP